MIWLVMLGSGVRTSITSEPNTAMSQLEKIVNPKGPTTSYDPNEPLAEKYVIRVISM